MKILIIRFSSIGDIVLTTPIIRCVRNQLDAEVHFLVKERYASIVQQNSNVSKVFTIEKDLSEAISLLRLEHYDGVVDLHGNIRSRKVCSALGVKIFRFKKQNIEKWIWVNFKFNFMPKKHIVDRYFDAIQPLGVTNDFHGLDYFSQAEFSQLASKYNLDQNGYIAISLAGTYPTKQMPSSLIVAIINRLSYTPVLLGGPKEIELAEGVCRETNQNSINLVGKVSLDETACVIQHSKAVLTGDTGTMHLSAAYKKKTISVWGNTHPELGMYPYILRDNAIDKEKVQIHQVDLKCRPCSKLGEMECPRGHFNCMNLQNVEEIVQNCNSAEGTQ